mmetsp:Transcript_6068/g.16137  ORF Transcript_6068/g.16137 Transcript_6068/m.16137 type:complete len:226 (+) Transcript_6068:62-739(+)
MVLEGFLNVTDVQPHGGDLSCHGGFHALAACNDGVRGIHARTHLVQVDVDSIHGSSEVLHVALASQHDAADVVDLALVVVQEIFELTNVEFELVQVLGHGVHARGLPARVERFHRGGAATHVRELLVKVALHVAQLGRELGLEVLQPRRHLFQNLCVAAARRAGLLATSLCVARAGRQRRQLRLHRGQAILHRRHPPCVLLLRKRGTEALQGALCSAAATWAKMP